MFAALAPYIGASWLDVPMSWCIIKEREIFAAHCLFVRGPSQLIHLADEKGKEIFFSKIAAKN
jgi:hypothetical protein